MAAVALFGLFFCCAAVAAVQDLAEVDVAVKAKAVAEALSGLFFYYAAVVEGMKINLLAVAANPY